MKVTKIATLTSIAVFAAVLFVTLVIIKPAMPGRIELLTGPEGSAYHTLGTRYATELRSRGLETEVIVTGGGLDNIRRLATGDRDTVAFAPAIFGRETVTKVDASHLVSLGSVGMEPLWLFYRAELDLRRIHDLTGRVVATEGQGTVSDYMARKLIENNGIGDKVEIRPLDQEPGESIDEAILTGSVDAGFVTGASSAPLVRKLLQARDVAFLSFDRADAYAAWIPGITTLTAPEGVFDLENNNPQQDAQLLSAATNLIALDRFPPAVVPMVLEVAADLQEAGTKLSSRLDFPSKQHVGLPLNRSARRYFDHGKTGLARFLPYRVTRWLNHLGFVVLPLLGVVAVLIKLVPSALKIWSNLRLTGLFKQLEAVEKASAAGGKRSKLEAELDRIDRASAKMFVPRSTAHDYIDFRQFLHDMRERVAKGV